MPLHILVVLLKLNVGFLYFGFGSSFYKMSKYLVGLVLELCFLGNKQIWNIAFVIRNVPNRSQPEPKVTILGALRSVSYITGLTGHMYEDSTSYVLESNVIDT